MDAITLIKQAHAGDKMARDKLILEKYRTYMEHCKKIYK